MSSKQPEQSPPPPLPRAPAGWASRALDALEKAGNRLPDPALLFVVLAAVVLVLSAALAPLQFAEIDPRTKQPIQVQSQLSGKAITEFLSAMVPTFTGFHPLGVVLVALLGVGIAEHSGFINAGLKKLLAITPRALLTPMLILVAIVSHTAADAGYVLVIPLGAVIFQAAGRHPLAGIAAAFAGVSGGFSANFIPSSLDPLLQGLTQAGAGILDPERTVNPLCNWFFCGASCLLVMGLGWFITDRVIEPRLARTPVDAAPEPEQEPQRMAALTPREARALWLALGALLACVALLVAASAPASSPLRAPSGELTASAAPLMRAIVPLIFLFFLAPGLVYGYASGAFKSHRDVIGGMSKTMSTMAYYLVMAFFAAQFIYLFNKSNLGALLALKGAGALKAMALPSTVTIVGAILLTAAVNLLIGSASAKWALLAPILVPMLMSLGISPELTQAAYRVGDSTTNIITPLMVYFPLVVVFCQKYVKSTGIGTLVALMVPYSLTLLTAWTLFLLVYWQLGLPLGLDAPYVYP
ncbi:aminobenzoyl-glutamate transporter [Sorangium cellulosum]|uniref:Aminobenzoyl-glutamate transporter n=1 Tax=Sorangium cellulosum TaxID=56 RepID=A0A4V0NCM9_SORCE|nr:AbgT family transporter [Sorangium cellulosum]AUX19732.1 aminobenzoyl-glutamate transporter [Sorangium cellulosum]